MTRARVPFEFMGCVELLESLGRRVQTERELMEQLDQVPTRSIFYHTYGYLLRHRFYVGPYANDFAHWVLVHVRDPLLGERLAVVDPFEFADIEALRHELIAIVDDHLSRLPIVPRVDYGEPFYFAQSHIIEVPTGHSAWTLGEFRNGLAEVDASVVYLHMVEARARAGHGKGDFGEWLRASLGRADLADQLERIDLYLSSLERVRARILGLLDAALAETGEAIA